MKTIIPTSEQLSHILLLFNIIRHFICAFDMSAIGAGKMFTTSYLSLLAKFDYVIVICPLMVEGKWLSMMEYGVPIHSVISFQSLRSVYGKQPKHGLLKRIDSPGETPRFEATELYRTLLSKRTLLVLDECQNLKNNSDQHEACLALIKTICEVKHYSRFILLSGSPIETEDHSVNMMKMLGFIKNPKLFTYNRSHEKMELLGAQELIDECKKIDPVKTTEILSRTINEPKYIKMMCYELFQEIIKIKVTCAMSPPKIIAIKDCKNGYYNLDAESMSQLVIGIDQLHHAAKYNEIDGKLEKKRRNLGLLTKALVKIENAKINLFARLATEQLEANPKCKVVIACNYKSTIVELVELLKDYKPLLLIGSTDTKTRNLRIKQFQELDTEHRLIIANLAVCNSGIDLDDKEGSFPRFCFASPKYAISEMHQLTGRFLRMDTKSTAKVRFVYGGVDRREVSILNALSRKSEIMKETLEEQVKAGILFPGDYEDELESGVVLASISKPAISECSKRDMCFLVETVVNNRKTCNYNFPPPVRPHFDIFD